MIISEEYFTREIQISLTQQEIDYIIEELERVPHNIFEFMKYDKLIKKLRQDK